MVSYSPGNLVKKGICLTNNTGETFFFFEDGVA